MLAIPALIPLCLQRDLQKVWYQNGTSVPRPDLPLGWIYHWAGFVAGPDYDLMDRA